MSQHDIAGRTGGLFGELWKDLSDDQFSESVELFNKRALANNFDTSWLKDKTCLDAGCGSGRYSVALASHGTSLVKAIDVSDNGLEEAKSRTKDLPLNIEFSKASLLNIPFEDDSFDLVWCAGVIHHTSDFDKGLIEVSRVTKKKGGKLFLLLYGAGGLRWKVIKSLRPLITDLGTEFLDKAIRATGLPANNRKHFMDDLLVPIQILTKMEDLKEALIDQGFSKIERWTGETYDQESTCETQLEDIIKLDAIVKSCLQVAENDLQKSLSKIMVGIVEKYIDEAKSVIENRNISERGKREIMIGEGLLRVVATKE